MTWNHEDWSYFIHAATLDTFFDKYTGAIISLSEVGLTISR